jgi:hypothetical protein
MVSARRLAPDDPTRVLDGAGIAEPFSLMADPEHGDTTW